MTTTVHDLNTPLERAEMIAGIADIDLIESTDLPDNVLAVWSPRVTAGGDPRHVVCLPSDLPGELRAEAILFLVALLTSETDLTPYVDAGDDGDDMPMVAVTRTRCTPDTGFGRVAVAMAQECGIQDPTSFELAER